MTWISRFLLLSLALFAAAAGANRDTTFAWDAGADWPSGTTVELCANGVCASGITATQHTLSVPVSPGDVIEGKARAHAPDGWGPSPENAEACAALGSEPPNCYVSDWATVAQTWPPAPQNLQVESAEIPETEMSIVQTGSTLSFGPGGAASGTVSSTITVPSDAEIVVVGLAGYKTTADFFTNGSMTFTKGGIDAAMTPASNLGNHATNAYYSAMFYQVLPDTGSNKSLKWDWGSVCTYYPLVSVAFFKGVDTSDPVRSTSGGQDTSVPFTSGTLTAQSGDTIVAWVGGFSHIQGDVTGWSNLSTLSQVTGVSNGVKKYYSEGAWGIGAPAGNTTVGATATDWANDGGIVAIALKPASGGITLSPNSMSHTISLASSALYQANDITPGGIFQTTAIGDTTVLPASQVSVSSITQGQSLDMTALAQAHVIAYSDLTQALSLSQVSLSQAHQMLPADIAQGQNLDASGLLQSHVISGADLFQSLSLSQASLLQAISIVSDGIGQAVSLDVPTLTQAYSLTPVALDISQALDQATLTSDGTLAPAGIIEAIGIDSGTLTQANNFSPSGINSVQLLDQSALTQAYVVVPSDLSQMQTVGGTALVQAYVIIPTKLSQSQALDGSTLVVAGALVPSDMFSGQSLASTALTQAYIISPEELALAQSLAFASLGQSSILSPGKIDISQALDEVSIGNIGFALSLADIDISQAIDVTSLIQSGVISTYDISQAITIGASSTLSGDIIIPSSRIIVILPSDRMVAINESERFVTIH